MYLQFQLCYEMMLEASKLCTRDTLLFCLGHSSMFNVRKTQNWRFGSDLRVSGLGCPIPLQGHTSIFRVTQATYFFFLQKLTSIIALEVTRLVASIKFPRFALLIACSFVRLISHLCNQVTNSDVYPGKTIWYESNQSTPCRWSRGKQGIKRSYRHLYPMEYVYSCLSFTMSWPIRFFFVMVSCHVVIYSIYYCLS